MQEVGTDNTIIQGHHISNCGFRNELDYIGLSLLKITYHLKREIS